MTEEYARVRKTKELEHCLPVGGRTLLAVLICPIVMGGMMIWMTRQMRSGRSGADRAHEDDR